MMKGLIVLSSVLLFACADVRTLEELEFAALESGDWSAVHARERAMERRKARQGVACPVGYIAVCENRAGLNRCRCRTSESVADMLRGW